MNFRPVTVTVAPHGMTFEVKLSIILSATYPLVILTKFRQNPIKHVEEEANCEKKERKDEKVIN